MAVASVPDLTSAFSDFEAPPLHPAIGDRVSLPAPDRTLARRPRPSRSEVLHDWQSLVSGEWSLVQSFESDGRRFLVARRNPPGNRTPLLPLEARALVLRAQGMSYKLVAHEIGVCLATAHQLVASGKEKLGIRSETELPLLLGSVTGSKKCESRRCYLS